MGDKINSVTNRVKVYLDKIIANEKLLNVHYEITSGSKAGDNYIGVLHRIVMTAESPDGVQTTKSLIYKCQPDNEARQKQFRTEVFFNNEAVFYNTVLPSLVQFQNEKCLLAENNFSSFPTKCYHAGDVLILEDMRPRGFVMRDRKVSLDWPHCRLAVREIGKFHALSFALRDQDPEEFQRLASVVKETLFVSVNNLMLEHMDGYYTKAIDEFMETSNLPDKKMYEKKLKEFQLVYCDSMSELVKGENAEPYAVINHGDCWTNNILFKYSKDSLIPEELCLLDFQIVRYASPVVDLSYFIYCCTDKDTRDEHYDNLMVEYHESLSQFLKQLGSDPEKLFPFSVFQDHLQRFSKFGLGMAILTIPLFTCNAEDLPDMDQICEDAETSNTQMTMDLKRDENDDLRWKRMNGVLVDMVDKGYLS